LRRDVHKSVSKISTRWIITKHVIKDVTFYALSSVHHINAKHYIVEKTLLYNVSIFIKMKDYEVGITAFVNKSSKEVSTIVKWVNDQFSFTAASKISTRAREVFVVITCSTLFLM